MKYSEFCLCRPWSVAASWSSHRVGSTLLPWYNSRYASKSHDWIWWLFRNNSGYCPCVITWCLICKTNPWLLSGSNACSFSTLEDGRNGFLAVKSSLTFVRNWKKSCYSTCNFSRARGNVPSCLKTSHWSSFQLLVCAVANIFLTIYWQIEKSCLSPPFICNWIIRPFSQVPTLLTSVWLLLICSQHEKNMLSSLFKSLSFPWEVREMEWKNVFISI